MNITNHADQLKAARQQPELPDGDTEAQKRDFQAGTEGVMPSTEEAQDPLKTMIHSIQNGAISKYPAFDQAGDLVQIS